MLQLKFLKMRRIEKTSHPFGKLADTGSIYPGDFGVGGDIWIPTCGIITGPITGKNNLVLNSTKLLNY